jgi:hypothetical protein
MCPSFSTITPAPALVASAGRDIFSAVLGNNQLATCQTLTFVIAACWSLYIDNQYLALVFTPPPHPDY